MNIFFENLELLSSTQIKCKLKNPKEAESFIIKAQYRREWENQLLGSKITKTLINFFIEWGYYFPQGLAFSTISFSLHGSLFMLNREMLQLMIFFGKDYLLLNEDR